MNTLSAHHRSSCPSKKSNPLRSLRTAILATLAVLVFSYLPASRAVYAGPVPVSPGLSGFSATVKGDVCNVRSGPSTEYDVVFQVTAGNRVDILDGGNGWFKISCSRGQGWIAGWLIEVDLQSKNVNARIIRSDVNLRAGPGTEFPVQQVAQKDQVYMAEAKRGDWVRISLGGGRAAWVRSDLIQLEVYLPEPRDVGTDLRVTPAQNSLTVVQTPVNGATTLASLIKGEVASVVASRDGWIAVETSNGIRGWVPGKDAVLTSVKYPSLNFKITPDRWEIRQVRTATITRTDVNFRSGPGTSYPVIGTLSTGDTLQVLETADGWIKGTTKWGTTGWVAAWLTDAAGNQPEFSLTVSATQEKRTVTLTGPFQSAQVLSSSDGKQVIISTSSFFGFETGLPINAFEFEKATVSSSDVTLDLKERASYRVKSISPGRVEFEFVPVVTSVSLRSEGTSEIVAISTLGYTSPTVVQNAGTVSVFLKGASYSGGPVSIQGQYVKRAAVAPKDDGLSISLITAVERSYVIRKDSNALEIRFGSAGISGKKIIVDPGHEEPDPGAIGPTGTRERDVNWEIAVRLAALLQQRGAIVQLTRQAANGASSAPSDWRPDPLDYAGSLAKRVAWSRGADLFVSIHCDYHSDPTISGTTSYISSTALNATESRRIAQLIQQELSSALGTVNRGVKDSNLFVTREALSPSVLVEVMYLSNPKEEALLKQSATWDKAAQGLLRAIEKYFTPSTP